MIKIQKFVARRDYRYLWLKEVKGTDLRVHCARCLLGKYDSRMKAHLKMTYNINLKGEVYYLCGVAMDRKWAHNLHIAFKHEEGCNFEVDDEFCYIKVENARRLEISTRFIDHSLPQSTKKEFNTCRNWQFANMIAKGIMEYYNDNSGVKQLKLF